MSWICVVGRIHMVSFRSIRGSGMAALHCTWVMDDAGTSKARAIQRCVYGYSIEQQFGRRREFKHGSFVRTSYLEHML